MFSDRVFLYKPDFQEAVALSTWVNRVCSIWATWMKFSGCKVKWMRLSWSPTKHLLLVTGSQRSALLIYLSWTWGSRCTVVCFFCPAPASPQVRSSSCRKQNSITLWVCLEWSQICSSLCGLSLNSWYLGLGITKRSTLAHLNQVLTSLGFSLESGR